MYPNETTNYQVLLDNLRYLKLNRVEQALTDYADRVQKQELSFLEALQGLTTLEVDSKRDHAISLAMKMAGFPHHKELKSFDFSFQPGLNKNQIYDLATLGFVERKENVVLLGSPGVGKTHLATSLGIEAAKHNVSAYFVKANDMLARLRKASDENRLDHRLRLYTRYRLLIIDELGFLPIQQGDEKLLFQVIDQRYENKSTIVTTNVQFSEWGDLFVDPTIAHAILDRLLHHAHVITIIGDSYRTKDLLQSKEAHLSQNSYETTGIL